MGMFYVPSRDFHALCLLGLYLILAVTFWYYPGSGMRSQKLCPIRNPNDSLLFSSWLAVFLTYTYYYTTS